MCLTVVVTLLLFAVSAQGLSFLKVDVPPETVSDLNPEAFVGRWYQMYASLIPNITYEKDGFCIVSDGFCIGNLRRSFTAENLLDSYTFTTAWEVPRGNCTKLQVMP